MKPKPSHHKKRSVDSHCSSSQEEGPSGSFQRQHNSHRSNPHVHRHNTAMTWREDQRHNGESNNDCNYQDPREPEQFLQAFGKPTQIYRYLGTHNRSTPVFLHRNLSYMKCRRTRQIVPRCKKLAIIADRLKRELEAKTSNEMPDLTISILSFMEPNIPEGVKPPTISVEAKVISVFEKNSKTTNRGKDGNQETKRVAVGIWEVPINLMSTSKDIRKFVFHVSKSAYQSNFNNSFLKSSLIFTAYPKQFYPSPSKYRSHDEEMDSSNKRRRKNDLNYVYRAEVVICEVNQPCELIPGDYEVNVKKVVNSHPLKLLTSNPWNLSDEGFEENSDLNNEDSEEQPKINIKVSWNNQNSIKTSRMSPSKNPSLRNHLLKPFVPMMANPKLPSCDLFSEASCGSVRIEYRFFYHSNDSQTTVSKSSFVCPWCSLNCLNLKSLSMHLKHCHCRFNFKTSCEQKNQTLDIKIDVSPNDSFDGSYAGNPHDMVQPDLGFIFSRNGPTRRNPVTTILFNKTKKYDAYCDTYDSENEDDECITTLGHDRLYYHTKTCLPIRPQDMDYDSESENDPLWMRVKTQLMIDEFTDVNEGEKEVMKLWNLLMMKYGFNADIQIPEACRVFINDYGLDIFKKNIRKNFILHLNCLYDFGLLNAIHLQNVIEKLNEKELILRSQGQL